MENENKDFALERSIKNFKEMCCPYGHLDIKYAIELFSRIGKDEEKLLDEIECFCEDTGSKFSGIDVCYTALDYIFQMARNKIDDILRFDICNDSKSNIDVFQNYIDTQFTGDFENLQNELIEKINEKSNGDIEKKQNIIKNLLENDCIKVLLEDCEINLQLS
jgi:hypothetical protein